MALFNDGPLSSLEDLRAYETSLLDTASVEGVSIAHKIELAQKELSFELLRFLIQQLEPAESITPAKLAEVVATEPLRRWHALRTLSVFFRDVHHNQLNDRYRAKWAAYEAEAKTAARLLWEVGVGLVRRPLTRPSAPDIELQATDEEFPQTLFKVTWVTLSGVESAASEPVTFPGGIGAKPQLAVKDPPAQAVGWHVYGGSGEGPLSRQTASIVLLDEPWLMPFNHLIQGTAEPLGQLPDYYVRLQRLLFRG